MHLIEVDAVGSISDELWASSRLNCMIDRRIAVLTSSSSCVIPYLPAFGCVTPLVHLSLVGGWILVNSEERRGGWSDRSFGLRSARGPVGYMGAGAEMGTGGGTGADMFEGVEEV